MRKDVKKSAHRALVITSCIMLSVVALLLWGRLKLVAGVPRTALAEPETTAVQRGSSEPTPAR